MKIGHYRGDSKLVLPGENTERVFVFMKYLQGGQLEKSIGYREKVKQLGGLYFLGLRIRSGS